MRGERSNRCEQMIFEDMLFFASPPPVQDSAMANAMLGTTFSLRTLQSVTAQRSLARNSPIRGT